MWADFYKNINLNLSGKKNRIRKPFQKLLNKYGYYKLSQLKANGTCGCCGERDPQIIWVDEGNWNMFSDIGICQKCLKEAKEANEARKTLAE